MIFCNCNQINILRSYKLFLNPGSFQSIASIWLVNWDTLCFETSATKVLSHYGVSWIPTIMNITTGDPFSDISSWEVAIFSGLAGLIETLGNGLLLAMMYYEKYGMDSMKRTVANQLWFVLLLISIMYNIVTLPLILYRLAFKPLG